MPDVQILVTQLQEALGLQIVCGSLTLNLNESRLSTYEVKTHVRLVKAAVRDPYRRRLDNRGESRQD